MPDRLLIRYAGPNAPLRRWQLRDGVAGGTFLGEAESSSGWGRNVPVWVVVSAELVGFARTQVSARTREQLARAVPFFLEDQLAEPVENLHFAIVPRDDGAQDAWWVARVRLREWLEDLSLRGLLPEVLLADVALLADSGDAVLLREDDRTLSVTGNSRIHVPSLVWTTFAVPSATAPGARELDDAAAASRAGSSPTASLEPALIAAAARAQARPVANLLVGEFAPQHASQPMRGLWRVAASLAVAAAGLSLAWLVTDTLRLESLRTKVVEGQRAVYRSVVPAAQTIPDPVGQLRGLEQRSGAGGNSEFMALAADAASVLSASPQVRLQQLDWRNESLELTLIAPDVATLDAFREACAKLPGVDVTLDAVGSVSGGNQGRVQMRRKARS